MPSENPALEYWDQAKNKLGKTAVLETKLCIGCGVCAYKCPTKSILLISRAEITEPPINPREYVPRLVNDFANTLPKRKI